MIIITNKFKTRNIQNLIKLYKLKNVSKLDKNSLLTLLNKNRAAISIQRTYRNHLGADLVCPISLCNVSYPFICIKTLNTFRYYCLEDFIIYLNKCNSDFRDPFTRIQYSNSIIDYVESMIKYYKLNKILCKSNWKKKKDLREEYLTLTHCINEIINEIFLIENLTASIIYNKILPNFIYYFHFLLLRHKQNCYTLLNNYINCINHHPNENKNFLINYFKLVIAINNL